MIKLTTGNLLESSSDALVNTVNCEGYMGKGIAYQFKIRYPKNNTIYSDACKKGEFNIGDILITEEDGKHIINFPTKNKWRKKSEYSYIEKGVDKLLEILPSLELKSISFPPLGCGNGGLDWNIVKEILISKLSSIEDRIEITLYEPSNIINKSKVKKAPKLNTSHLVLMLMKEKLIKFNKIRLQKSAYLLNYFLQEDYFKFQAYNFGPYANSINILSRDIKEFQTHYNFKTNEAIDWAINTMISASVNAKLKKFNATLKRSTNLVNEISDDKDLELLTTLLFIIENNYPINQSDLPEKLKDWSEYKFTTFPIDHVNRITNHLLETGLILKSFNGLEPSLKKLNSKMSNSIN